MFALQTGRNLSDQWPEFFRSMAEISCSITVHKDVYVYSSCEVCPL